MLCIALYYRALYKVVILPVFRSKNDFRDFDGKEMQVKYDFWGCKNSEGVKREVPLSPLHFIIQQH